MFYLHAGNCTGKNKNYLMSRTLMSLHTNIMFFFLVEHTKFSPDWCFGLLKDYQQTKVSPIEEIASILLLSDWV